METRIHVASEAWSSILTETNVPNLAENHIKKGVPTKKKSRVKLFFIARLLNYNSTWVDSWEEPSEQYVD